MGGGAAVLGGVLTAALILLPAHYVDGLVSSSPGEYLRVFLTSLSALLLAGGLVGLHARQGGGYGRLGAVGFLLAFVGVVAGAVLWPAVWFATEASGGAPPRASDWRP